VLRWIRNFFICVVLAANSLHGVAMRPDEIQALMDSMNRPKVAHELPVENHYGDDS
jgi:hypothetical protein